MMLPSETVIALSFTEAMSNAEKDRQAEIVMARQFHMGEQSTKLTERLKQFLGEDIEFSLNVSATTVTSLSERLSVIGFDSVDAASSVWAGRMWRLLQLDSLQEEVHEYTLRDGEHFVLIDWVNGKPIAIPHNRYTDVTLNGDGFGCYMKYLQDDPKQEPLYGVKIWSALEDRMLTRRMNKYFPDRIEKYAATFASDWVLRDTVPWLRLDGSPRGIALVHFKSKGLECAAKSAWPIQRAVNKALIDLLASSDLTAFRIFYSIGFFPTTDGRQPAADGSNWMVVEPGQIVGTTRNAKEATFGAVDSADLSPLMNLTHQLVLWLASVTNTPVSRFISSRLVASDATLKEQEGPMLARINSMHGRMGHAWGEVMSLLRGLVNDYGAPAERMLESEAILPIWGDPAARGLREKLELSTIKKGLGVPLKKLWSEIGYDQPTIEAMWKMRLEEDDALQARGKNGVQEDNDGVESSEDTSVGDEGSETSGSS